MYTVENVPYQCVDKRHSRSAKDGCGDDASGSLEQRVMVEAQCFRQKYEADVQFICSRLHHHGHALDAKGKRVPLKYCRATRRKDDPLCKRGIPKKVPERKSLQGKNRVP